MEEKTDSQRASEVTSFAEFLTFLWGYIFPKITREFATKELVRETYPLISNLSRTFLPVFLCAVAYLWILDPLVLIWIFVILSEHWVARLNPGVDLQLTFFNEYFWIRIGSVFTLGVVCGLVPSWKEAETLSIPFNLIVTFINYYFEFVRNLAFYRLFTYLAVGLTALLREKLPQEELAVWLKKLEAKNGGGKDQGESQNDGKMVENLILAETNDSEKKEQ